MNDVPPPPPFLAGPPVIAVLRARTAARFVEVAHALCASGVLTIELTLTSSGALAALRAAVADLPPAARLGMGSARTADDVDRAVEAGAGFVVGPAFDPAVVARARRLGIPVVPGALTPTEVLTAAGAGATAVKVFPIGPLGGARYLAAVRGPLPDVPLIPTGGVAVEEVPAHLAAGAVAVGIGGPLLGDAAEPGGDLPALRRRAGALVRSLAG